MLKLLALAVLADAGTVDGGTRSATIYDSCPEVNFSDGGSAPLAFPAFLRADGALMELPTDAGGTSDWYLPYPRAQRASCRIEACIERNEEMETWKKPTMQWVVVSTAATAFLSGMVLAYTVCTKWPVTCGLQR